MPPRTGGIVEGSRLQRLPHNYVRKQFAFAFLHKDTEEKLGRPLIVL